METKRCPKCALDKPLSDFGKAREVKGGLYPPAYCKSCMNEYNKQRRRAGYVPPTKRTTAEQTRVSWLRRLRLLGISEQKYDELVQLQNGACAICQGKVPWGRSPTWHVDHDHKTGKVRGLLCSKCNRGLGHFDDKEELLTRAAAYLREHNAKGS